MNLGQLKTLARGYVPAAKRNVIETDVLELMIQNGVYEVARDVEALPTYDFFDVEASNGRYFIRSVLPSYLNVRKEGLWWYDGARWKQLNARTIKWFDEKRPNWRDLSASSPQDYAIDGDEIVVVPKPDTAYTNGFCLYFYEKPDPMTDDNSYPFGGAVEISRLSILSTTILYHWRKEALKIVGAAKDNEIVIAEQNYDKDVLKKRNALAARPDVAASRYTKLQGPVAPRSY